MTGKEMKKEQQIINVNQQIQRKLFEIQIILFNHLMQSIQFPKYKFLFQCKRKR